MGNTVIFLGAGASKADGAPLQNELFKSYFIWSRNNNSNKHEKIVKSFFKSFFGILHYDEIDFPTFEEALGILDIAYRRVEEYKDMEFSINEYRSSLIYAMTKSIECKLDLENSISINSCNTNHHRRLLNNLRHNQFYYLPNELFRRISFISTNYDLLIDNAIHKSEIQIDYGFDYKDEFIGDGLYRDMSLFKIHGSLNYLFCPVCGHITVGIGEKNLLYIYENPTKTKCVKCNSFQQSIIVPPSYFKSMNNIILNSIWAKADKALRNANKIIFCGYSFPDADIHIKYLMKRAEINRDSSDPLKITVMNYYKGKEDRQYEIGLEKDRFSRFFKNFSDDDYLVDKGFEDLAEDPMMYINI